MSFDIIRLPEEVEQGAQGGPQFQTSIVELSSGNEQRNEDWANPKQSWDVGYGVQGPDDFNAVRDFFFARRGRSRGFLFKDWSDFSATGVPLGTGDGVRKTFLLTKTYEVSGPDPFVRRITRPVLSTLVVYLNGVPTAAFTTGDGGWVRFTSAPGIGVAITADFQFDVPVRFEVDTFPLTLDWQQAAEIGGLSLKEVRDDFNAAPTAVSFTNTTTSMAENTSTSSHVHVADIVVTDDPFGTNTLSLTGTDAASFEIVGTLDQFDGTGAALYIKAGVVLDFELKPSYSVTVNVDDASVGSHPAATATFNLTLTDVNEPPSITLINETVVFPDGTSTASPLHVADIKVLDDALGLHALAITGADAAKFQLSGSLSHTGTDPATGFGIYTGVALQTIAGLDYSVQKTFLCNVTVADSGLPSPPQGTAAFSVTFGVTPGSFDDTTPGTRNFTVPNYSTLTIDLWGAGAGGEGINVPGSDGGASSIASLGLTAGGGKAPVFGTNIGGAGGTATGGDTNTAGKPGSSGVQYKKSIAKTGTGSYSPTSFQFSTVQGGNSADNTGAAGSTTGAAYTFVYPTVSKIDVNGAVATDVGGGGAGCVEYGVSAANSIGGFFILDTFANGTASGGGGSRVTKTYTYGVTAGFPTPGASLSYTVGAKGTGGLSFANGGDGFHGRVRYVWS